MEQLNTKLLTVLKTIKGNGNFVSSGNIDAVLPGLTIRGIDETGLPLNPDTVLKMIQIAKKAPYGKGSQTVLNTTVRSSWEIDGSQVVFKNKQWTSFFNKIGKKSQERTGFTQTINQSCST